MSKSKKAIAVIMLLVTVLFRVAPVFAEDEQMSSQEGLQQFKLFVNCQPVYLAVEGLHNMPDAEKIGLTRTAIINAAESRLRSAGIYTDKPVNIPHFLYINVNVLGSAFNAEISLHKMLHDSRTRLNGYATTWDHSITGTHGQNRGYILSSVSSLIDHFLVEYFRVNEKACEKK